MTRYPTGPWVGRSIGPPGALNLYLTSTRSDLPFQSIPFWQELDLISSIKEILIA
jgi:hypothetical protein